MKNAGRRRDTYRLGVLTAVVTAFLYGVYPAAMQAIYADGGNVAFMLVVALWGRTLGLALYCLIRHQPLFQTYADTKEAIKGGVLQTLSAIGVALALTLLPGPLVIITVFSHTLMLLFFLAWRGEIKLDAATVVTTVLALGGLSLVLDIWHMQSVEHLWGIGLALFAAVVIVFRSYVYERQTRTRNPAVVGAENFLVASLCAPLYWFYQMPHPPSLFMSYVWIIVICVTMAIATFLSFFGISWLGAFRWSLLAKLEPVFTALFSALLIGQILKSSQYVGMLVVLGSLALYQLVDKKSKKLVEQQPYD